MESPSAEELNEIVKNYNIHPLVVHELVSPSQRSKVDPYDDFMYLILHFPTSHFFGNGQARPESYEIDFVLGKDFLITVHYQPIQEMEEFAKVFESNSALNKKKNELHAGLVFFYLIQQLYQSLEPGLDTLNDSLKRVEGKIFDGHESEMVSTISTINRQLLDFKWAMKYHKEVLASLEIAGRDFYGDKFGYYLRAIVGEYEKIWNLLESQRETFMELRQTNETMLSIKTNETMKVITVLAMIFLPATLIGTIFGMSGDASMPIIKNPGGFYVIVGAMALAALIAFAVAKVKKWL
jgi:magnesium transporter